MTVETAPLPPLANSVVAARIFGLLFFGLVCAPSVPVAVMSAPPLRIDLCPDQTPIRKQGGRGHSMLIVGYDRTDPQKSHFIVKNSWGPTKTPGANDFTYIGYDYLPYGTNAGYLNGVKQVSWTGLRFVGRWEVVFDGWKGILDVTHVPGVFRGVFKLKNDRSTHRHFL